MLEVCVYFSQFNICLYLWFWATQKILRLKKIISSVLMNVFFSGFWIFTLKPKGLSHSRAIKSSPTYSLRAFIVLLFTFLHWIHLEFNLVDGMYRPNFRSFPDGCPPPSASKWRIHLYLTDFRGYLYQILNYHMYLYLYLDSLFCFILFLYMSQYL